MDVTLSFELFFERWVDLLLSVSQQHAPPRFLILPLLTLVLRPFSVYMIRNGSNFIKSTLEHQIPAVSILPPAVSSLINMLLPPPLFTGDANVSSPEGVLWSDSTAPVSADNNLHVITNKTPYMYAHVPWTKHTPHTHGQLLISLTCWSVASSIIPQSALRSSHFPPVSDPRPLLHFNPPPVPPRLDGVVSRAGRGEEVVPFG